MTIDTVVDAIRKHFWLIIRYVIAGILGTSVQTFTLYVWVSLLGYEETYLVGAFIAFCLAVVFTFTLQKFWTFRDHALHRASRQFYLYSVVAVLNLCINLSLLALAKSVMTSLGFDFFNGWYLVAQIAISLVAAGVSFLLNFIYTFSHAREEHARLNTHEIS